MNYIELSGRYETRYGREDDYNHYVLVQTDGLVVDLIGRFSELKLSGKEKVQVSYFVSNEPVDWDTAMTAMLSVLDGAIDAKYWKEEYYYSSWTRGSYTNETLSIGGHDLIEELAGKLDKYVILRIVHGTEE